MRRAIGLVTSFQLISTFVIGQVAFRDIRPELSIPDTHGNYGVFIGDYNNDGHEDIFITRRSANLSNSLYQNTGNGTFKEVTEILPKMAANSKAAVWFDFNNDGWLDLFISNNVRQGHQLFRNNRNETFTDVSIISGIDKQKDQVNSVNAGDLNGDGWLDLYLNCFKEDNELYINNQDGSFTDVVKSSGANSDRHAMGVVLFDYDNDVDLDIYATFDGQPFILYENDGNANFKDVSIRTNTNYTGFGMGVDIGDVNQDGLLDLYITNLYENTLLLNAENRVFENIASEANVDDLGMGWGCNFFDFDNDSQLDIYVINEFGFSPEMNVLYRNKGGQTWLRTNEETTLSPHSGFGSAILDVDNNGSQDILVANTSHPLEVFKNESEKNNWIKFKLLETEKNIHAIGAKVSITTGSIQQIDQLTAGSGHASQSTSHLHFGIGEFNNVEEVKVEWPNGESSLFTSIAGNSHYLIDREDGISVFNYETYKTKFTREPVEENNVVLGISNFGIYPNPAKQYFALSGSIDTIEIVEIDGKVSYKKGIQAGNSTKFNISDLSPGLYLVITEESKLRLFVTD